MARLVSDMQIKTIMAKLGRLGQQMQRDHITQQKEVAGTPFEKLSPTTIAMKLARGGGVAGNANKRMQATNDFKNNAFTYAIEDEKLVFGISTQPHQFKRTESNRERMLTRMKSGKKATKKAIAKSQYKNITYTDIAKWQLRGPFDQDLRRYPNPGADFFGFSKENEVELSRVLEKELQPVIIDNIIKEIINSVKGA
jgi:hypothetical protein